MRLVYTWPHKLNGVEIGEIRRYLITEGGKERKIDIPYYTKGADGWVKGIPDTLRPWPLLGLDTIKNTQKPVVICEGQKKQYAWRGLGFQVVATLCGSGAAEQTDWSTLKGCRRFWIAPDNDPAGERYAEDVWNILRKFEPEELMVVRLPRIQRKGDVCDWLKLQPELSDWNEYDPLDDHPSKNDIRERLATTCLNCRQDPSWTPKEEWEEPADIKTGLAPVHRIPPDLIPPLLQPWILDAAERMGSPLEYFAVNIVVGLGAVIGASVTIRPKREDNWAVVPNLWGCIAGPVSSMKTPASDEAKSVLQNLETKSFKENKEAQAAYDKAKLAHDARVAAIKERAGRAAKEHSRYGGAAPEDPDVIAEELPTPPEPPACRRFICNDATQEALCQILAANPRGVLLYQDELYGLISGWDKEGRQTDRPFFLQGYNGNQPWTVDRATKQQLRIANLCISILGCMQPDTIRQYLVAAGDNLNDGLMQRFQVLILTDKADLGDLDGVDRKANWQAKESASALVARMAELDWTQYGAALPENGNGLPYYRFSWDAQELYFEWERQLKAKCRVEQDPSIEQHLHKYRSLMPSLALIFHCLEIAAGTIPAGPVSLSSAQLAADWCAFLEEHARRIYGIVKPRALDAVHQLAGKVKDGRLGDRFAWHHVQQKNWKGLRQKTEILEACRQLQELNWVRQVESRNHRSGPPKLEFVVNPKVNVRVS